LYLCKENSQTTGQIYEIGGRWVGKLRWERTEGAYIDEKDLNVEGVHKYWDKINDFTKSNHPKNAIEAALPIYKNSMKSKL
jgi:hypothetical protein